MWRLMAMFIVIIVLFAPTADASERLAQLDALLREIVGEETADRYLQPLKYHFGYELKEHDKAVLLARAAQYPCIKASAKQYGIPPALFLAIASIESAVRLDVSAAHLGTSATGMFQVVRGTYYYVMRSILKAEEVPPFEQLKTDALLNCTVAAAYLDYLYKKRQSGKNERSELASWREATMAYFAGEANISYRPVTVRRKTGDVTVDPFAYWQKARHYSESLKTAY